MILTKDSFYTADLWMRIEKREIIVLIILTILNTGIKVWLRIVSLWDWDDVVFAYGVQNGDLYAHSPGYPGYMLLARIFYLTYRFFTGVAISESSMILLSALIGGLTIVPVYWLIRILLGKSLALVGSLFILLNPFFLILSVNVNSDIPSTFFVTLSVALFYLALKKRSIITLLISALIYGFSIATRLSNIVLFPLFLYALIRRSENRYLKSLILFILSFISTVIIAYIPLISHLGMSGFIEFMTIHNEVNVIDYSIPVIKDRILQLLQDYIIWVTPIAFFVCVIGFYKAFKKHRKIFYEISIWIVPYVLFYLLWGPNTHRFYLPTYPALSLLFAVSLEVLTSNLQNNVKIRLKSSNRKRLIFIVFLIAIFVSIFLWSLPVYNMCRHYSLTPPPPKQFVSWIQCKVPKDSVIIAGEYYMLIKYYTQLPDPMLGQEAPSLISYRIYIELINGRHVFVISTVLEKCSFLRDEFELKLFATYDSILSLYEIYLKPSV